MSKKLSFFIVFVGLISLVVGIYRIMPSEVISITVMAEKIIASAQIIGGVGLIFGGLFYFKRDKRKNNGDDNL